MLYLGLYVIIVAVLAVISWAQSLPWTGRRQVCTPKNLLPLRPGTSSPSTPGAGNVLEFFPAEGGPGKRAKNTSALGRVLGFEGSPG